MKQIHNADVFENLRRHNYIILIIYSQHILDPQINQVTPDIKKLIPMRNK